MVVIPPLRGESKQENAATGSIKCQHTANGGGVLLASLGAGLRDVPACTLKPIQITPVERRHNRR